MSLIALLLHLCVETLLPQPVVVNAVEATCLAAHTVDGRNPAGPYIDRIYQKYRSIYIYILYVCI